MFQLFLLPVSPHPFSAPRKYFHCLPPRSVVERRLQASQMRAPSLYQVFIGSRCASSKALYSLCTASLLARCIWHAGHVGKMEVQTFVKNLNLDFSIIGPATCTAHCAESLCKLRAMCPLCHTVGRHCTPDRITQTIAQVNVARVERLIEEIRKFGYQGKLKERLAHS